MSLRLLPLVALSLLLGACSSFQSSHYVAKSTLPPPIRAGIKITPWGELPSYEQDGHFFKSWVNLRPSEVNLSGRVVVEVLVKTDGTVRDVAIFESSGDSAMDQLALRMYKYSRYSLRLDATDPAPHVVRQEFIRTPSQPSASNHIDVTNYRTMGPDVRATSGPYSSSSSVTSQK